MATLPEQHELDRIIDGAGGRLEVSTLCSICDGCSQHPVRAVCIGTRDAGAPGVGFFAGVHGLERVGTQVVLAFLGEIVSRLGQDDALEALLATTRLVFMPIVNPAGMSRGTRANANGVDLMRNAPLDARERVTFMVGGQRWSSHLPWYRGTRECMEAESQALCALAREELLSRPFSLTLDCHSGFGVLDRIWFPHAHTRAPFARVAEVHALVESFARSHPGHGYLFEPQSRRYRTHGDLWDFLCERARTDDARVFIPLTLEMGSWRWVRKNPRQMLTRLGLFNPLPPDRLQRVRRHHLAWLDFLCHAAASYADWLPRGDARSRHERRALADWFGAAA
jgi:hypothetical protein